MSSPIATLRRHQVDLHPFEEAYKRIYRNPELSRSEVETAVLAAAHLRTLDGVQVQTDIGGNGVVGTLRNGPGPTVMLRADMHALPHLEKTGLPYASTEIWKDAQGNDTPVMHACGHDMHTANLMAAASFLSAARAEWSGTAVFLFQPAEEIAYGARAMPEYCLYDEKRLNIPKPDMVLGSHVHGIRTGQITLKAGALLTAVDSYRVRVFGKSGHICRADLAVDAVLTVSHIITRLQDIVTREVRPEDFAVVGCASVHGGSAVNFMPDYCDFTVSIRSFKPAVHERLLCYCEANGPWRVPGCRLSK